MQLTLQASNIKCGGCVSNVENGLKDLEGIESVSVELESNKVTVTGENLDQSVITSKMEELGYPVTD